MGIDGVDENEVPLPNVVVDFVKEKGLLNDGIMYIMGNAVAQTKMSPNEIAEQIAAGKLDITTLPHVDEKEARASLQPYIDASLKRIIDRRRKRENYIETIGEGENHTFTSSLLLVTSTKTLSKLKQVLDKVQILSPLSVLQDNLF